MSERRALVEGVEPTDIDPKVAKHFIKHGTMPQAAVASLVGAEKPMSGGVARARLTTRIRADLANALKRASLKRQLNNETPNEVQEIIEEALEPWLRSNGYLS